MYLKKVDGPRAVRLPDGQVITLADLPPADTKRWVASRKALVVRAVLYGLLTQGEAMKTYALSEEEFFEWVHAVRAHGEAGLKVTQLRTVKQS
ncbi:CtrA inhibitor SciP [Lentibacter sp.]|uniref:CtrA inhibitor SciP n=1 Tax=Lentibacter sp. TaxID=2024994 RepID=UPI003F6D708E